jgi:hypothetical protein
MATNLSISPQKAQEIMKRADSAMAKLSKIRGKTEEKVGEVFKLIETVGGAVAVGYARSKWGEVTVGPDIPIEALVGAGLSLTAFLDLPGKYSEHLHNVGNGILGGWGTLEAVKLGGGIVLSKEEYNRLSAPKEVVAAQGEVSEQPARREANLLPNGQRRQSARESFAEATQQRQEVESSNS